MKHSTLPLIFFMFWVEIFDITVARPAAVSHVHEGLQNIQQDVRKLSRLLTENINISEMMQDFEEDLTSLPMLNFSAKDLESLEVSSTLAQMFSGLKSFLFHFDWLQQEQEQQETDFSKTKKIIYHIKTITFKILRQIGTPPSEPAHPTLPPLKTSWKMYQATLEIHKKLYMFCDWYSRALGALRFRH